MNEIILYLAAAMVGGWGVAHLLATRGAVAGFGELGVDNRRVLTMEWISEGVALISIAVLVAGMTAVGPDAAAAAVGYAVAIATLLALAGVSLFTGFRVHFLPYRLCPLIFSVGAALIGWGGWS